MCTNASASAIFALISLSTMGANAFAATLFASVTATSVFTNVAGFIGFRDGQWVGCCCAGHIVVLILIYKSG